MKDLTPICLTPICSGIITGLWDVVEGTREIKKGNYWLGGFGIVLGLAGGVVGVALYYTWIAVFTGFVITLIIIAISLAIMWLKDNALQDWLERTLFGALDGYTYDPKQERVEYTLAMEAMKG